MVGVNRYAADADSGGAEVFRIDPEMEQAQIDRVRALRSSRSQTSWQQALGAVEGAARAGENLVPAVIDAVEQHATVGEIADTLRRVFGEYQGAE